MDDFKLKIEDKIGFTVLSCLNVATNMALRKELMLHEQTSQFASERKRFIANIGSNGRKVVSERTMAGTSRLVEEVTMASNKA